MYPRLRIFDGSSLDEKIAQKVSHKASWCEHVMVNLDSNHTHEHVLSELNHNVSLVQIGGYCVEFDTVIEDLDSVENADRPWEKGNNPKTTVAEF